VIDSTDSESQQKQNIPLRAFQLVHHLKLKLIKPKTLAHASVVRVQEEHMTVAGLFVVLVSEAASIAAAIVSAVKFGSWWMFAYFLLPLLFKYTAALVSVGREGLMSEEELAKKGDLEQLEFF
jgi:hypothetical protein